MIYYFQSKLGFVYKITTDLNFTLTFSEWLNHLRLKEMYEKPVKVYHDFNIMPSQEGKSIWFRHSQSGVIKFVCGSC